MNIGLILRTCLANFIFYLRLHLSLCGGNSNPTLHVLWFARPPTQHQIIQASTHRCSDSTNVCQHHWSCSCGADEVAWLCRQIEDQLHLCHIRLSSHQHLSQTVCIASQGHLSSLLFCTLKASLISSGHTLPCSPLQYLQSRSLLYPAALSSTCIAIFLQECSTSEVQPNVVVI